MCGRYYVDDDTAKEIEKMVRESVLHRRCMIPARSFYEWDPDRNKVTFQSENQSIL